MPTTLPVSKELGREDLCLFTHDEGKLLDAYSVEYEILDESDGSKVFPAVGKVDATTNGRSGKGFYSLYDPDEDALWTPESELPAGKVVWSYKLEEGGKTFAVERRFAVADDAVTSRAVTHMGTIADMKAAGVSTHSDRAILGALRIWTDRIERYCRRSFVATLGTERVRRRPGTYIILDRDIVALEFVREVTSGSDLDLTKWEVFGCITGDMNNPRIEMHSPRRRVYGASKNLIRIGGVWGTVDPFTLEYPFAVEQTLVEHLPEILIAADAGAPSFSVGPLRREKTDIHEVEYAVTQSRVRSGMLALLRSGVLRDQLDLYRAPSGVAMVGGSP